MSSLEPRSGNKTLLKLLLDKSNDVLTQSKVNERAIQLLESQVKLNNLELILIKKQLELLTEVKL